MSYIKSHKGKSFSNSQHSFAVAQPSISRERSTIDRPSRTLTAIDASIIYPILVDEVLPGDTFKLSCQIKAWLATPLKPFLDNLYLSTFFFFVPNRLVWDNWARFQGAQDSPGDSVDFTIPQISIAGGSTAGANKLADYFGIPTIATTKEVCAFPFRGYNLVNHEFFRDQNLQDEYVLDKGDANSTEANHVLLRRGKRKDYITGCLPWPQKPSDGLDVTPAVITGLVPVIADGNLLFADQSGNESHFQRDASTASINQSGVPDTFDSAEDIQYVSGLQADLDTAEANTINQLRQSIAIQQLLELDSRGGTRHIEQIKARFGVTSSDFRLQRPEYLGGNTINISVTPVPATSQAGSFAVGALGAFGMAEGNGGGFTHSFTEHGYVLGLVSLRSDISYQEGLPRHWSRLTRFDYYEPGLAHLGEQPVYNQEVFVSNTDADDIGPLAVWGYQERFAEYKYGNSMITSIMRSNHPTPIDFWHLGEELSTQPTLNAAFIVDATIDTLDRALSVLDEAQVVMDAYFTNKCTRVMPVHNTPGLTRL